MSALAEAPSQNGHGPKIDIDRYRRAVKATMRKSDPSRGRVEPTEDEVDRFLLEASLYGLDPLAGQIYASWQNGEMRAVCTIDGLRLLAERTGRYEGQSEPEWCDKDGNWTDFWTGADHPVAARVRVHKKGTKVPTTGTANWHDFAPLAGIATDPLWNLTSGKPAHMLTIRAEALALRKAFPAELSGLYTVEELGLSLAAIGADPEGPAGSSAATDVPAGPGVPRPAGAVLSPTPNGSEEAPAVIVDPPTDQPSGAPALPQVQRTLAEVLASGEYQRLHGDLTKTLFDQLPDRLTNEQSEILASALAQAEEAEVTPIELERLCKVLLAESKDNVESRRRVLLKWISERRLKVKEKAVPTTDTRTDEVPGLGGPQPGTGEGSSLLDADPGPEGRA